MQKRDNYMKNLQYPTKKWNIFKTNIQSHVNFIEPILSITFIKRALDLKLSLIWQKAKNLKG